MLAHIPGRRSSLLLPHTAAERTVVVEVLSISSNLNHEFADEKPGNDFKDMISRADFREDLTRRMQREALKTDRKRWDKEE